MRLIKNLHFIQDFSRVRVCAAAAPPPSDRTNSERRPFAPRIAQISKITRRAFALPQNLESMAGSAMRSARAVKNCPGKDPEVSQRKRR